MEAVRNDIQVIERFYVTVKVYRGDPITFPPVPMTVVKRDRPQIVYDT